jgi:hypothetical protein
MSDTFKPEKDTNRSDLYQSEKGVNVYDNDDAYMLNDGGEHGDENIYSLDELGEQDINDNESEINAARGYRNEVKELTDEETVRTKQQAYDKHEEEGKCVVITLEIETSQNASNNLKTLQYISICQSCRENFNSTDNIPYLFKCGHFFCMLCIANHYTDEEGRVFCPDDGLVAGGVKELKVLTNLIVDRSYDMMSTNRDSVSYT